MSISIITDGQEHIYNPLQEYKLISTHIHKRFNNPQEALPTIVSLLREVRIGRLFAMLLLLLLDEPANPPEHILDWFQILERGSVRAKEGCELEIGFRLTTINEDLSHFTRNIKQEVIERLDSAQANP